MRNEEFGERGTKMAKKRKKNYFFLKKELTCQKNLLLLQSKKGGSGSVGRALASQAEGRGFESRLPLQKASGLCC